MFCCLPAEEFWGGSIYYFHEGAQALGCVSLSLGASKHQIILESGIVTEKQMCDSNLGSLQLSLKCLWVFLFCFISILFQLKLLLEVGKECNLQ